MREPRESFIQKLSRSISVVQNPFVGWLIFFASVSLTLAAYFIANAQLNARGVERFEYRSAEISQAIQERLAVYEQALWGGAGLFNASTFVDRNEWRLYVESLNLNETLPGIQGMGYATPVKASEKEAHTVAVRAEGFPDYHIRPDTPREEYSSIIYLEPFDWRNQRAFGFDMWSNEMRRAAMMRARDEGIAATSGLITLVQETETDVQRGFLTYVPVYKIHPTPDTVDERREAFEGWVYAAFRAGNLMQGVLRGEDTYLNYSIYDGDQITEEKLLFSTKPEKDNNAKSNDASAHAVVKHLVLQGRPWLIEFITEDPLELVSTGTRNPIYILIAGAIINILLLYVLVSLFFVNRYAQQSYQKIRAEFEKSEGALQQKTRHLEVKEIEADTFFELAPDAFFVVNYSGVIVKANQQAHDLFGYEKNTLHGLAIEELVPSSMSEAHRDMRKAYVNNPEARVMADGKSLSAMKKSGEIFLATINLVALEIDSEKCIVAAVHDVSAQQAIQNHMAQAREKAEVANRAKSDFVANMSHEIRTPLNAVLGAAQLLGKLGPSPRQKKYIDMIRTSGSALLGIINDILDLSKIESGKMELELSEFDLDDLLQRVAQMLSVNVGEKKLDLVVHVSADVPRYFVGDALRLQQVLINLTSNAIKFTHSGQICLRIDQLVSGESGQYRLHVGVSDTGIGMDELQQDNLFQAFTQADTSITRRFGGTGLGLVISSKIVSLMGGSLGVLSDVNQGSIFSFTLNLEKSENRGTGLIDTKPLRLLVLDKNASILASIKHIVRRWGWTFYSYQSYEDFAEEADNIQLEKIDFCLVSRDIVEFESHHFCTILRDKGFPDDAGLVLSLSNTHQATTALSPFDHDYNIRITKPITSRSLMEALDEARIKNRREPLVAANISAVSANRNLNGVRILLVEDNMLNQNIAEDLLEDSGVLISIANNGKEAVDRIVCAQEQYDIVLMDIQMPVMDGVTATKLLRREHHFVVPIVAMTAGVLSSETQIYLDAGMNDLIPKPIDGEQLIYVIEKHVLERSLPRHKVDDSEPGTSASSGKSEARRMCFNSARMDVLTKGKPERIIRVCRSLRELIKTTQSTFDDAILSMRKGDKDTALAILHGLKGVCANYGGEVVHASLAALEKTLHEGKKPDDCEVELAQLQAELVQYLEEAECWCVQQLND